MGTFKNLLSIQSLKIPFTGVVIVPVMCVLVLVLGSISICIGISIVIGIN